MIKHHNKENIMDFNNLNLKPEIIKALEKKNYKEATPIQAKAIPVILEGNDILGGAQTGTGKTAAFALPIINKLTDNKNPGKLPRALVITPTRELANQVAESFKTYSHFLNLRIITIFGGVNIKRQYSEIRNGADVVVATPGRLLDHLQQQTIKLSNIEVLILDEADRMLDMGFINDIKKIIRHLPKQRQNLLFCATYSDEIKKLAENILQDPVLVEVSKRNATADKIEQKIYKTTQTQKRHLLIHLIKEESWYQVLIFTKTKHGANRLTAQLLKEEIPSVAIHGNKSQAARTRALNSFKKGDIQALIATDVAARGIDLQDLSHVVNYDLPQVPEDYIHRIGRTGRAGQSGIAISLITPEDSGMLRRIEKLLKKQIPLLKSDSFVPVIIKEQPKRQNHLRGSNVRHTQKQGLKHQSNKKPNNNYRKNY